MLMFPYQKPVRESSDQGGSTRNRILYKQYGLVASGLNVAATFIPCGLKHPQFVQLTPVKLGTTSANGVALGTTTVVAEVDSLDVFSAVADLAAHAAAIAYVVGNIVKATPTGGTLGAYVCVEAHTSTAGPAFDTDIAKWQRLPETTFLKINHTAAGVAKVAHFTYQIVGFNE
jgi:hypothetical protein